MAIDLTVEKPIPLGQVPDLDFVPRRRRGRKLNVSTVHRWAQRGLRGVRLETLCFGGTKCTTVAAMQRFFEALSEPAGPAVVRTSAQRERAADRAEAELSAAGV